MIDLKKSKSLLDALRIKNNLNYLELATQLAMPYQSVRRMCKSTGTPRTETLVKLRLTYPGITDTLWRRFSYLVDTAESIDFLSAAEAILSQACAELEHSNSIDSTMGRRAKAVSFYLHEEQIQQLCLLSSVLGKSQSQIIRDYIYELSDTYLKPGSAINKLEETPENDILFKEPTDTIYNAGIVDLDLDFDMDLSDDW